MRVRSKPPAVGQSVTGSVVFGSVTQVQTPQENVTISSERPLYRVEPFRVGADTLSAAQAQAQPSRLLQPRYRIVPFSGRDQELHDLDSWLCAPDAASVRLIHAAGGHGKTRLAALVAEESAAAGWLVWRAMDTVHPGAQSAVEIAGERGLLVIVDYADRWANSRVLALIATMRALNLRTGVAVRVLLLARSAGFWWLALTDYIDRELGLSCSTTSLGPVGNAVDRGGLFTSAAAKFAAALELERALEKIRLPALSEPDFALILSVHMAALVAVLDADADAADLTAERALSAYLLRREAAHWQVLYSRAEDKGKVAPQVMARTCYTATLTGALERNDAQRVLHRVGLAATNPEADSIIDEHCRSYPTTNPAQVFEPMQPDRLGEDFVALATPGHGLPDVWPADNWTSGAASALINPGDKAGNVDTIAMSSLTFLVEAARRWPHVAREVLYPLIRQEPSLALIAGGNTLTRLAGIPGIDIDVLETVDAVVPAGGHIEFDAAAAEISHALTARRLASTGDLDEHARAYVGLARRLFQAGRSEEAGAAALQAIEVYRGLDVGQGDSARLGALAWSLSDMGAMLCDLDRPEEALAALDESTELLRGLVELDPETFLPSLAISLANRANALYLLGRLDLAVNTGEAALDASERGGTPKALATALTNLSSLYSEAGRHSDALHVASKAMTIMRPRAVSNLEAHMPTLVVCSRNLARCLRAQGDPRAAMEEMKETVAACRQLAGRSWTAYDATLAGLLDDLAAYESEVGGGGQAVQSAGEAVTIRRELADADSTITRIADLANSLNKFGGYLNETGRYQDAFDAIQEAQQFTQRLGTENAPAKLMVIHAEILTNLATCYRGLARLREAVNAAIESVGVYRRLVEINSAAYSSQLAKALSSLGVHFAGVGESVAALTASGAACHILSGLAATEPDAYRLDFAESLVSFGNRCQHLELWDKALAAHHAAVGIFRDLSKADPDTFSWHLARGLNNISAAYSALDRDQEALAAAEESVSIKRKLVEERGESERRGLATSLVNLAAYAAALDRSKQALAAGDEAVAILSQVTVHTPGALGELAAALVTYVGACLSCNAVDGKTLDSANKAVKLCRQLASESPAAYTAKLQTATAALHAVESTLR
jgi:tetratricopeptide (TPR) repeat protein